MSIYNRSVRPEQVLDVIAERLREWPVDRQGAALLIENLNLHVTCGIGETCGDGCALVSASHPSLPRSHEQHCAGWGDDERSRAEHAADAWLEGTFEVLHDFICEPKEAQGVERWPFVVRDEESRALKGFRAIVGPIEVVRSEDVPVRILRSSALFGPLVGPVDGLLVDGGLHWLRLFAGQLQDDAPAVDCWFDNVEWPGGAEVLAKLRADWGPVPGYEGLRQSVLFKPVPIEQIPASTIAALPK